MIWWVLFETSVLIEREMWQLPNCTYNGPNAECLFTVTHVQSFFGMLTEAANAAWQAIAHLSQT